MFMLQRRAQRFWGLKCQIRCSSAECVKQTIVQAYRHNDNNARIQTAKTSEHKESTASVKLNITHGRNPQHKTANMKTDVAI